MARAKKAAHEEPMEQVLWTAACLLEGDADGFHKIRLCHLVSIHYRNFYEQGSKKDSKMQGEHRLQAAPECKEQEGQGK